MTLHSFLLISLLTFQSCGSDNSNTVKEVAETFDTFNIKFHSDSLFQISRIKFPLQGKQIDAFEEREWTLKNWVMLKVPVTERVDTTEYKHTLNKY
jgi:hypothetical protein